MVCALQNISAHLLRDVTPRSTAMCWYAGAQEARMRVIELIDSSISTRRCRPLEAASLIEPITALLIRLNIRNKVHSAGIRITGLPSA